MSPVWTVRRSFAVVLACAAGLLLLDYPAYRGLLAVAVLAVGIALARWPLAWLAVLPAAVPALELAHWSGRLFVEDIDILFAWVLAILWWQRSPAETLPSRLPGAFRLAVWLLVLSYGISLAIGMRPWPDWNAPDALAGFLGEANALRLAKGFFWALLFSPFVFRAFRTAPETAQRMLVGGMVAGMFVTGAMFLWERGVWTALIHGRDVYQLLAPLLDFSTAYRITGTFAEMNTGGETIDGYLGLVWPMMALALALSRRSWALAVSSLALALAVYGVVTTFSRGLYFSLVVAGAVWLFGVMRVLNAGQTGKDERTSLVPALAWGALAAGLAGFGYSRGGMLTLAGGVLALAAAIWLGWRRWPSLATRGALVLVCALCLWAALRGMLTSKWHSAEFPTAALVALGVIGGTIWAGWRAGRHLPHDMGYKPVLVFAMLGVLGAGTLAPALLGYRMTARLADVKADFDTRASHWRDAAALQQGGLHALFGMGLGSFPRTYYWNHIGASDANGSYALLREAGDTYLRTSGSKDLRVGQRLSVDAHQPLRLQMRVRSHAEEARLKIRLCRRFVIHPTEWNGQCVTLDRTLKAAPGQWETLDFQFDAGAVGDDTRWGRAPMMLEINNRREYRLMNAPPAVVDIDDIRLTDRTGRQYVTNGDFERGLDRWLPYYDFNHLPWHIKNHWLHLYFEQGLLGVLAFAVGWLLALGFAWREAGRGAFFPLGLAAALTGFVAVGTFGSPIDAPRIAWLYYFLWFALIAQAQRLMPHRTRARLRRHAEPPSIRST